MKRLLVIGTLGAVLVGSAPVPARAGAATDVALGLGAFAVFNQLTGWAWPRAYYPPYPVVYSAAPVVYSQPPVVYTAPPVAYAAPAPLIQREVVFPNGRYVLNGDGVTVAYQWVWVPNLPPPPPPPPPPASR